jgi:hypothetical protein
MATKHPDRRPRDPNQMAKLIVDILAGEVEDTITEGKKNPAKRKGRAGGLKGGTARAETLTQAQRTEIARTAASARWKKN